MYRSKHQKGYLTSHEVKNTHFRTWKSGKKWLYSTSVLVLVVGALAPIGVALLEPGDLVQAAVASTDKLTNYPAGTTPTPVYTADTQTAAYTQTQITNASNTTMTDIGANPNAGTANWNNGTLTVANATAQGLLGANGYNTGNGWGTFNNPVNMTKPLTLNFSLKATVNNVLNTQNQVGEWEGAFFVPVGTKFTNSSTAPSKTNTAISGIANSFFLGRNYGYNGTNVDWEVQVSQTDANANQTDVGVTDGSTIPANSSGDIVKITWTPSSTAAATTTGTLTMVLSNGTTTTTISKTVTMQNSMQIGFSGSVGAKGSNMTIYNVSASAYAVTAPVTVNYRAGSATGAIVGSSTIIANVGDSIGVIPTGTTISDSNTYDYTAPTISGKNPSASYSATVTSTGATIDIPYTNLATTQWYYMTAFRANGVSGSSYFPYNSGQPFSNVAGAVGSPMAAPSAASAPSPPAGYAFTGVKYNGSYYYYSPSIGYNGAINGGSLASSGAFNYAGTTLQAALSAAVAAAGGKTGTYGSAVASGVGNDNPGTGDDNVFLVMQEPAATFQYSYASGASNTPTLPTSAAVQLVSAAGSTIVAPSNYDTSGVPSGYYISSILNGASSAIATASTANSSISFPATQNYQDSAVSGYSGSTTAANLRSYTFVLSPMTNNTVKFTASSATNTTFNSSMAAVAASSLTKSFTSQATGSPFTSATSDLSSYISAASTAMATSSAAGYYVSAIMKNGSSYISLPAGTTVTNSTTMSANSSMFSYFASLAPSVAVDSAGTAANSYTEVISAVQQSDSYYYGYSGASSTPSIPPTLAGSGGLTGTNLTPPASYNTSPQIPSGYYVSGIYSGTASSHASSALATGTANTAGSNNARNAVLSNQTFAAGGNNYYLQLSPLIAKVTWTNHVIGNDPITADNLGAGGYGFSGSSQSIYTLSTKHVGDASSSYLSAWINRMNLFYSGGNFGNDFQITNLSDPGSVNSDNLQNIALSVKSGWTGNTYTYIIQSYTLTGTGTANDGTSYPTIAALLAANPTITVSANQNIVMNMFADQTALVSKTGVGTIIPKTATYIPSNDLTSGIDYDGTNSDNDPASINGSDVVVNIVGVDNSDNYWGDAKTALTAGTLEAGNYIETFYGLNYLGKQEFATWQTSNRGGSVIDFMKSLTLKYQTDSSGNQVLDENGNPIIVGLADSNGAQIAVASNTPLVVTNFLLPFTGGKGMMGLVGLAALTSISAMSLKKKKKQEENQVFDEARGEDKK